MITGNEHTITRAYTNLGIAIFFWGSMYVLSRYLSQEGNILVSPVILGFLRYFLGFLAMLALILWRGYNWRTIVQEISKRWKVLLLSALLSAMFVITVQLAVEFIASSIVSIIVNMSPVIVFVYSIFFLNEPSDRNKVIGFIIGIVGSLIIFLTYTPLNFQNTLLFGEFLALAACITWAGYTITLKYLESADRYIVMSVKHLSSSLMILPFLYIFEIASNTFTLVINVVTLLCIFYVGALGSGVAYLYYFDAIKVLSVSKASSFLFLIPIVTYITAMGLFLLSHSIPNFPILFPNENIPLTTMFGGLLTVIGIMLITSNKISVKKNISPKAVLD